MTTFYTADLHFSHANIQTFCPGRPGTDVTSMNEILIANWNAVVQPEDEVWVLGDFDMHGKAENLELLPRLNGTKYLVAGNHDAAWGGDKNGYKKRGAYLDAGFEAVVDFAKVTLPPLRKNSPRIPVLLSHFPYDGDHEGQADRYSQFRLRDEGVPLLCGHVHDDWAVNRSAKGTLMINVGVDVRGYAPVSEYALASMLAEEGVR